MTILLSGLSTAQPTLQVTQSHALELALDLAPDDPTIKRILPILYRKSGVKVRSFSQGAPGSAAAFYPKPLNAQDQGPTTSQRMRRYALEALPLAADAARQALDSSAIPASQITHLVVCSCTGLYSPGLDIQLIATLGLPPTTARTIVGFMGCHGAFNALALARNIALAQPSARVLVVAVELCSLHLQYHADLQQSVANALFGDGAAATVVMARPSVTPPDTSWVIKANGNCLFPDSQSAMTWIIADHGYQMTLSPQVPDLIQAHLGPWIDKWLASHSLSRSAIASWAIHPGGPKIVEAVEQALTLPPTAGDTSRQVLETSGNMSSATIMFILQRLAQSHAPGPCVAIGFGPGLVAEAMLLTKP
jgi:predicted naringenin-chalcone synthase